MAYNVHNFQSGAILYAAQLNEMDNQILDNDNGVTKIQTAFGIDDSGEIHYATHTLIPSKHKNGILVKLIADTDYAHATKYNSGDVGHQYSEYSVTPGTRYLVSGDVPESNEEYVVAAFYDQNGDYVSRIEREEGVLVYVDYEVTAPANADFICIIKYGTATGDICLKEQYTITGSAFVDGMYADMIDAKDRLTLIEEQLDEANSMTPGTQLTPTGVVVGSIYNVRTRGTYGDNPGIGHSFYDVEQGGKYFYTASCATNPTNFPAGAFYDSDGNWIASFGEEPSRVYEDILITAPGGAVSCVLNRNNGLVAVSLKEALSASKEEAQQAGYNLDIADALIRLDKRNAFEFAPMPGGLCTFVFDDLTLDVDKIASVFAEYGFPMCFAAIPSRLPVQATGLTEPSGDYTVGMTMREVMTQAVLDGGEVLVHNSSPVITTENMYNFEFMFGYFVQAKRDLVNAGFDPHGIIRAGGTGAIERCEEFDRWLIGNYAYSNMGTLAQYAWDRINTRVGIDAMKTAIDTACTNHTWISFMAHGLDIYESGEAMSDESKLREILTYCQTSGINVVTCKYVFDHYSSSVLAQSLLL